MRPTHVPAIHTATVLAISLASQVRNAAISPRVGSSSGTPMISIARDAATGSRGVETLRGRARTSGSAREGGVRLPAGSRLHSASVVSRQPRFEPSNRDFCAKWRCFLSHEPSNRQQRRTPKCRRAWDASATLLRPGGFDSRPGRISRRFSRDTAFRTSHAAQTPTRAFPASSGRRATPRACARPRAPARRSRMLAVAFPRLPSPLPAFARPSSRGRRALGVVPAARARTMPPPAAPSRASAFETVAEAVVPPLPLDDRSPPPRDAPPAPGAAGHDGRWNLAAATRAAFPERFPTLAAARESRPPRRDTRRGAPPRERRPRPLRPRLLRPRLLRPSAPLPSPGAAITALAPALSSPSRGARRRPPRWTRAPSRPPRPSRRSRTRTRTAPSWSSPRACPRSATRSGPRRAPCRTSSSRRSGWRARCRGRGRRTGSTNRREGCCSAPRRGSRRKPSGRRSRRGE